MAAIARESVGRGGVMGTVALLVLLLTYGAAEVVAAERVDFEQDIVPLLEANCFECHGEDRQEGWLRLDARAVVLGDGLSGEPLVKPGDAEGSVLYQRVAGMGDEDRMPLDAEPLPAEQIQRLRRWIEQGASWPEDVGSDAKAVRRHWAYEPVQRPALPEVHDGDWVRNPIDRFVLARLEGEDLRPTDEAEPARLIRRVYLDLTGLPPSVEEVDAFLADDRPDAYERVVDRLLSSPAYGERWAQHWLDLARYADSHGYQSDQMREVWPYRDWVIDAINADMPFDQFTIEQLAGDLLPDPTRQQRIATGFQRQTPLNMEGGVAPEEARVEQVADRVNTLGTVWLGTTLECAQCHNHKYDPFSIRDYYQFYAFFNNTPLEVESSGDATRNFTGPRMELPTEEHIAAREKLKAARQNQASVREKALEDLPQWTRDQHEKAKQGRLAAWRTLNPRHFESAGGADYERLDDGSLLITGARPDKDTYTLAADLPAGRIAAVRLEALTHPSLPGDGPGRHHPERPNFVLNKFSAAIVPAADEGEPDPQREDLEALAFDGATAGYSQSGYPVSGAIDGKGDTGWAIHQRFGESHTAVFTLAEPIEPGEEGGRLAFELVQNHGGTRTIGRLRLSVTDAADPLPDGVVAALKRPAEQRSDAQREAIRAQYLNRHPDLRAAAARVSERERELEALGPVPRTLVMVENDDEERRTTRLLKRGNYRTPGEVVEPATPGILHPLDDDLPRNRLGLARWLVDPENPLTARVTVNRWWAELFGAGLVRSEEDLGTHGDPPTHPALLDYLADEFVASGWSTKHIHRLMVTSATYRQSARAGSEMRRRDPENKLLGRASRLRLPAEMIRDNALAISGLLTRKQGGEPIYPPQPEGTWRHIGRNQPDYVVEQDEDRFRRGVYVVWRRSAPFPAFVMFDAPDRAACTVTRSRTNTPLQALTLMNDRAYVEMAWGLARHVATAEKPEDLEARMRYAFRRAVARHPDEREHAHLVDVFREMRNRLGDDPARVATMTENEPVPEGVDPAELAAWFHIASILLNLDETITRG